MVSGANFASLVGIKTILIIKIAIGIEAKLTTFNKDIFPPTRQILLDSVDLTKRI